METAWLSRVFATGLGKVDLNLSRVIDPDGRGLVRPDDLGQALAEA